MLLRRLMTEVEQVRAFLDPVQVDDDGTTIDELLGQFGANWLMMIPFLPVEGAAVLIERDAYGNGGDGRDDQFSTAHRAGLHR